MKRSFVAIVSICVLIAVCLCGCGDTEQNTPAGGVVPQQTTGGSLRAALNVPESLSRTWYSNTGRTVIEVSAVVEFTEADAVPIIEVSAPDFTEAQISRFAEVVFEGRPYHAVESGKKAQSSLRYMNFDSDETYYDDYYSDNLPLYSVSALLNFGTDARFHRNHVSENISFYIAAGESFNDGEHSSCGGLSFGDALSKAEGYVSVFSPGMQYAGVEISRGSARGGIASSGTQSAADKFAYVFHFTKPYAGIAATYTNTDCVSGEDSYTASRRYECVNIMISEYGLEEVEWRAPYETVGVLEESAALLSFDEIADIAETMLPLKYASFERDGMTNSMLIDRITFGYTRVRMKDDPSRYMMVPAWDFFGMEAGWKTTANTVIPFESLITINAVDGTVIDRAYGY